MRFKDPVGAHRTAGIPLIGRQWRDETLADDDVSGVIFQDCVFEGVRFERIACEQTLFLQCRLTDCSFSDAKLVRTHWVECEGSGFSIAGGAVQDSVVSDCRFERLDVGQQALRLILAQGSIDRLAFNGAGTRQETMTVSGCTFGQVEADNVNWHGASAVDVDLRVWSLQNAAFNRCCFIRATADDADLSAVHFNSCNLYESTFRRARLRDAGGSIFAECDLEEADCVEANLNGALFAKAKAPKAHFERARINNAIFAGAALPGASFAGALATQSVWTDADLTSANLERINAFRGIFRNATLKDALMQGARLVEADLHGVEDPLDGADTRGARGSVDWRAEREAALAEEARNAARDGQGGKSGA